MEISYILSNFILWMLFQQSICGNLGERAKKYDTPCPNECDLKKCPKLQLCEGEIVKDRCGCCPDCSTNVEFNSTFSKKDGACKKVACNRFKVCMENMQGLPLCTCPNPFVCRGRRRQVCGRDGQTYESRCHMRVISCHKSKRIKMAHKGACGMVGTQQHGVNVKYQETEFDISARRRKTRKQSRRKNQKAKRRRRKQRKKKKQGRPKRRRGIKRKNKKNRKKRDKVRKKDGLQSG